VVSLVVCVVLGYETVPITEIQIFFIMKISEKVKNLDTGTFEHFQMFMFCALFAQSAIFLLLINFINNTT